MAEDNKTTTTVPKKSSPKKSLFGKTKTPAPKASAPPPPPVKLVPPAPIEVGDSVVDETGHIGEVVKKTPHRGGMRSFVVWSDGTKTRVLDSTLKLA